MPYCRYCGVKADEDLVFCPNCWEVLTEEDTVWQEVQIQVNVDEAKHRANMYTMLSIVLVTLGIIAGCVLCVSSSTVGLFGIVLVCLGIGCTASADRHEHKAKNLKERFWR